MKEVIKVDKELMNELIAENADLKLKNIELKEQLAIREKALELAIDDGDNKITDACFVDRTAYNWDSQAPSMLCEEDYIQQAEESLK